MVTLKSRLGVTQGRWKWHHSKSWVHFPIRILQQLTVCEIFSVREWRDFENWVTGHLTSLKLVPFESFVLFAFHSNYGFQALSCIISEIKPDIGRKSRFYVPPLHSTLPWAPLRGSRSEYCDTVWQAKTRMVWLSDGKKVEVRYNRCDRIPECDRQTDRQTNILRRKSPRYAYSIAR